MLWVRLLVTDRLFKFWGNQRLFVGILLHWGLVPLIPVLFRGQLYNVLLMDICFFNFISVLELSIWKKIIIQITKVTMQIIISLSF